MNCVFVVDTEKTPLTPVTPQKARVLLEKGKAAIWRQFPFTIILKHKVENPVVSRLRLKIDPGSRVTGMAIVNEDTGEIIWAAELTHRGLGIRAAMEARAAQRRSRRSRKTPYRAPRFDNRTRKEAWLPPSLESRIANIQTWVARLSKLCPIAALSMELVKFDMQHMTNPEIEGAEYQQGTLAGYEVREYLLEKWGRACTYCGKDDVKLQVEHIEAKSRGGSDRISNLCLACEPCNTRKGTKSIKEFLKGKPEKLRKILAQQRKPLHDAAAVNTTRWELYRRLEPLGLPLETGSGGLTKFNRSQRGLPKTHWLDAACVGLSTPQGLKASGVKALQIAAKGHGCRQRCTTDKFGFPNPTHAKRQKKYLGFQTGDIVQAKVLSGKYKGTHVGRIAIRFRPRFHLLNFDVHPQYLRLLQRADGYSYVS